MKSRCISVIKCIEYTMDYVILKWQYFKLAQTNEVGLDVLLGDTFFMLQLPIDIFLIRLVGIHNWIHVAQLTGISMCVYMQVTKEVTGSLSLVNFTFMVLSQIWEPIIVFGHMSINIYNNIYIYNDHNNILDEQLHLTPKLSWAEVVILLCFVFRFLLTEGIGNPIYSMDTEQSKDVSVDIKDIWIQ